MRAMVRFNVLLAHRRFGKTYLAIVALLKVAQDCPRPNPRVHYFSPTYSQSKRIAWDLAKQLTADLDPKINESELRLDIGDTRIQLGSAENPDSNRGIYSDFAVLDEPSQMPPSMWTEVIRPALSDRGGSMLMIGTPKGRHGLFYESYQAAQNAPDWYTGCYPASCTGVLPESELRAAQAVMSRAEYQQEYECDWSAAIKGAYWGEAMSLLEAQGHITRVPYDETLPVHSVWDLGMNDSTAIWAYQVTGGEYRFIRYLEFQNTGLAQIVGHLRGLPYLWGRHTLPQDVKVRSLSTGQSRQQTLHDLGLDVTVAPQVPVEDGIEKVRAMLPRCWFDAVECKNGIEALRQYRSDYDEKGQVLRLRPVHDWSSHAADAMRYLAVSAQEYGVEGWRSEPDYSVMDAMVR